MFLEIVTPERTLLSQDVTSFAVPGINGEFQVLNDHAPVVAILKEGKVRIDATLKVKNKSIAKLFIKNDNEYKLHIKGGVLELKNNKAIILTD